MNSWLQIKCLEPVRIYKVAICGGAEINKITLWVLEGKNDGGTWSTIYTGKDMENSTRFFNVNTAIAYQYYRIQILSANSSTPAIRYLQMYSLDPIV